MRRPRPAYSPLAFAVTIVWHNTSTGEILDADMMINDQLFIPGQRAGGPYANCPDGGCLASDADLRGIVTHEAGHFIGIGHSPIHHNPTTLPRCSPRPSERRRQAEPSARRHRRGLRHLSSRRPRSTCIATPMGGLQLNCETTPEGNPIACDAPGSTSSGGCSCSTAQTPADALWLSFAALVGLSVIRRRSARRGARS